MFEIIAIIAIVLAIAIAIIRDQAKCVQHPARHHCQGAAGKDFSADQRLPSVGDLVTLRKQGSGDEAQL
jgi:hypothetical protein